VGIRVLDGGVWGLAATTDFTKAGLRHALEAAQANARALRKTGKKRKVKLGDCKLSTEDFEGPDYQSLLAMPVADKLAQIVAFEQKLASTTSRLQSARCRYNEIFEDKIIVTSDGAAASIRLALPEVSFSAVAEKDGELCSAGNGAG